MKKTVKSLIIASSVAAIAGIGAVSFAAWSGGSVTDTTILQSTATIAVAAGKLTATDSYASKTLIPYDQKVQIDTGTMKKMQTITLTYGKTNESDSIPAASKMDISMKLTALGWTADEDNYLMYNLSSGVTQPAQSSDLSSWKKLQLNTVVSLTSAETNTINVILVSSNYNTAGSNKSYTITFSATEKES